MWRIRGPHTKSYTIPSSHCKLLTLTAFPARARVSSQIRRARWIRRRVQVVVIIHESALQTPKITPARARLEFSSQFASANCVARRAISIYANEMRCGDFGRTLRTPLDKNRCIWKRDYHRGEIILVTGKVSYNFLSNLLYASSF